MYWFGAVLNERRLGSEFESPGIKNILRNKKKARMSDVDNRAGKI